MENPPLRFRESNPEQVYGLMEIRLAVDRWRYVSNCGTTDESVDTCVSNLRNLYGERELEFHVEETAYSGTDTGPREINTYCKAVYIKGESVVPRPHPALIAEAGMLRALQEQGRQKSEEYLLKVLEDIRDEQGQYFIELKKHAEGVDYDNPAIVPTLFYFADELKLMGKEDEGVELGDIVRIYLNFKKG